MTLRTFALTLTLAFALLLLLVTLNWAAFAAPTALSLGFIAISAPLAMIMLVFTAVVSGLFVVYILVQQAGLVRQLLPGVVAVVQVRVEDGQRRGAGVDDGIRKAGYAATLHSGLHRTAPRASPSPPCAPRR